MQKYWCQCFPEHIHILLGIANGNLKDQLYSGKKCTQILNLQKRKNITLKGSKKVRNIEKIPRQRLQERW